MTGKRGLSWARSSSPNVADGAVAGAVSRDGGCREELTLAVSFRVPAASPNQVLAFGSGRQNPVSKAVIGPLPRPAPGRNGAVVRVSFRAGGGAAQLDELRDVASGRGDVGAWG